jgi:N-glycosylase/DNA lyase
MKEICFRTKDFSLPHIFECGQAFRWRAEQDGSYSGVAFDRAANISFLSDEDEKYEGSVLIRTADRKTETVRVGAADSGEFSKASDVKTEERFWENYLDIRRDYGKIKAFLSIHDPMMREAIPYGAGIRILNQDPWEALITFIISQNNNIARIKGCVESLCREFGEPAGARRGREYRAFPGIGALASANESEFSVCRLGYRAEYIAKTAKTIAEDGGERLYGLRFEGTPVVREYLENLPGVGPKVASCVTLFAFGRMEAFPIDVWVRRAMRRMYGIDENGLKTMREYAALHFGDYGGVAQQYLFHYIRNSGA